MTFPYIGGGPYCYANTLAMAFGPDAPDVGTIEILTGAPFGMGFLGGLPFFSPPQWDPEIGIGAAAELLGWTFETTSGGAPDEAIERLRLATRQEPVLAGPVEMGLLLHQPGSGRAIGADHYVTVLAVEDGVVRFHDPHGHPFTTLPAEAFTAAWHTDSIDYPCEPFTMRTGFRRAREVGSADALRACLPAALRLLAGHDPGAETNRLADLVLDGLTADRHAHLVHFAVRVGARRLGDASVRLGALGLDAVSDVLGEQARLVGALQYPLVAGDRQAAAGLLRTLAPAYDRLRLELLQVVSLANDIR